MTRSRPLTRPLQGFAFGKFLSSFPERLKSPFAAERKSAKPAVLAPVAQVSIPKRPEGAFPASQRVCQCLRVDYD
jgi:hypothetical protein